MPPDAEGAHLHLHIEPAAMTGRNAALITAANVVDNIEYVWYVAVVVIASDRSLLSFGGTFGESD